MEEAVVTSHQYNSRRALTKLSLVVFVCLSLGLGVYFTFSQITLQNRLERIGNQKLLLSIPLTQTNWKGLGTVSEPKIKLDIQTDQGNKPVIFILDSGAVVSSLSRELAPEMGKDLAFLKRTAIRGFGNQTSFAYHSEMALKIGETEMILPIVFTESQGTQALLGRKGFFDNYSITFNHILRTIEIRE